MAQLNPVTKSSRQLNTLARSEWLSELAKQSLIAEAELTPKPGLVDGRGSGSHTDLSLDLMRRSANTIAPYFTRMALVSAEAQMNTSLRAEVASIGREAEAAMLGATSGSNAHKGAIWVLGLLVCAASLSEGSLADFVAEAAGYFARLPDRARPLAVSHGDVVLERYGATGARGEAYVNFPHVVKIGLPALKAARKSGRTEQDSRLAALLAIMSHLDDTCVLHRGGPEAQRIVHEGAAQVIEIGGPGSPKGNAALIALGQELVGLRISPGGSADLLAATLFLDALERGLERVEKDNSLVEENDGEN
ncbi:triphosphoribosyl-dephospho-CoA synthase [Tunturiibacter gelidoferens]|jgi:triphosphoribosyl-dephospho-CoA synthase|uniref:triphosphoribosyl-dephospho-CoA synthase n=1 Tax=Tunturiibacter gelidiferens TaxID=3069689 RepID=A0A9X0U6J9_9BACT|nr:triphosphoribosyl-dephospho-CoA synthase [Edaphobacter lichenicola]MBB5331150.1 triphosphoribosyl-dephospho-CoA synthase [Edaphobacter lichenicola]